MGSDPILLREVEELQARLYELLRRLRQGAGRSALPPHFEALVCEVLGERVALPLAAVDEVVPLVATVPLPEASSWIVGLMNLRGTILPVLDVAGRFGRAAREPAVSELVVICRIAEVRVGLVVATVHGIADLVREAVQEPASGLAYGPYLLGVTDAFSQPTMLLSVERLVELSDIPELPTAETAPRPEASSEA